MLCRCGAEELRQRDVQLMNFYIWPFSEDACDCVMYVCSGACLYLAVSAPLSVEFLFFYPGSDGK